MKLFHLMHKFYCFEQYTVKLIGPLLLLKYNKNNYKSARLRKSRNKKTSLLRQMVDS